MYPLNDLQINKLSEKCDTKMAKKKLMTILLKIIFKRLLI